MRASKPAEGRLAIGASLREDLLEDQERDWTPVEGPVVPGRETLSFVRAEPAGRAILSLRLRVGTVQGWSS